MTVIAPDISTASQAVAKFEQEHGTNLAAEHRQILSEIQRRLSRLQKQAAELMDINNRMWAKQGIETRFDAVDESIVFSVGGVERRLKFKRADPKIPVAMNALSGTSAYHAGNSENADEEEQVFQFELEERIESFYQSAHRILKLFGRVPALEKIKSPAVTRVRNNLIEHPKDGSLYSFGVGTTGPRVKPMYRGSQEFNDDGLMPNIAEFVAAIVKGCAECAT